MIRQGNKPRRFAGWHVVAVMALFFGTITSANLVMAWYVSRSWSGLVVAALKRPVEEHEDIRVELLRTDEGVFIAWIADVAIMSRRALVYLEAIGFVVPRERQ